MKEKNLLKIAMVCSVIGLTIIFFIAENTILDPTPLQDTKNSEEGRQVKVVGVVTAVNTFDKVLFLKVGQQKMETVDVVLFKDHDFDLEKGQYVEIFGEITEYKGKNEIVADRLRLI